MISFNYENDFSLDDEKSVAAWLSAIIVSENKKEGKLIISFVTMTIYTNSMLSI
jgi:hypothetical protein